MKHILANILAPALVILGIAEAEASVYFAPSSRLSSGNWVKVGVDKSGIYEISYSKLLEMGFSDPTRVGVMGRGGKQMETNFTDANGTPLNADDLSPIAVLHHNGRIYFYGQGVDHYSFYINGKEATGGHYERVSKNIYSNLGYYFLSDSEGSRVDMSSPERESKPMRITRGVDLVAHEKDMVQNTSHSGQLFWGERFNNGEPSMREWRVSAPGVLTDVKAMMECYFYSERVTTGTLSWGIAGSTDIRSGATRNYNSLKFRAQDPTIHTTSISSPDFRVFLSYDSEDNADGIANLDYWTLTFARSIPYLKDNDGNRIAQEHIGIPGMVRQGYIIMDEIPDAYVFNVSDPAFTEYSTAAPVGNSTTAVVNPRDGITELYIADLSLPQLQIKGYTAGFKRIDNQDLHALAKEGASLLIIATPELVPQAERLARVHRSHDGIRVVVASSEQAYNEFSCGVPDPMAYRLLAKMLYESEGERLQNVLLLGSLYSDFRGVDVPRDSTAGLIAFQSTEAEPEKGAANVNDFIGMMSDRLPDTRFERCPVEVGVGILPCQSPEEADAYIDKVESYLEDDSFAYRINRMLTVGGLGDRHTHDIQAIALGKYLNTSNDDRLIPSVLIIDAYGSKEAGRRFKGALDGGCNIATYFGHGAPGMLGKDKEFFSAGDVGSLTNKTYPFMFFAGCILSNSDRGIRGIAESMVLGHDSGLIGAVLASRDTWSGENMDMMKILHNRMYKDGNSVTSPSLEKPLTIGQVFARAKSQSEYANELSYQLLCDPAIIIPVATLSAHTENAPDKIYPGREMTVTGQIIGSDGKTDKNFNGELVVRLMYPERNIESQDLDSGSREEGDLLTIPYIDIQAAAAATEVKEGHYTVTLRVPSDMEKYLGGKAIVNISAYDKERRLGAASSFRGTLTQYISSEITRPDTEAPVIEELSFDSESKSLSVKVTDKVGLDTSDAGRSVAFRLSIDGKAQRLGSETMTRYTPDAPGYSKTIPMGWLGDGLHRARVEISDMQGNVAARELIFLLGTIDTITLKMLSEAAREEAMFEITGVAEDATVEITTPEGYPVASLPVSGETLVWNLTRADGTRVAPGLYRAFVREGRGSASGRHSEAIYVAVTGRAAQ